METSLRSCPWCSTSIPGGATTCPQCGATVEEPTEPEQDTADLAEPAGGPDSAVWLSAQAELAAVLPPDDRVRAEMLKMQLEAELANAGGALIGPDGAHLAAMPSREAIEALQSGAITLPEEEIEQLRQRLEGLEADEKLDR